MTINLDPDERAALREVAATCLCQKARNAARALTRFYDQHYAGSGIEPTQFNLLVAIRLAGPVSMLQLAGHVGLERTTLTRNLALLRRDGLVAMKTGKDARQHLLSLTETGRRALQKMLPRWRQAQKAALATLGNEDFTQLLKAFSLTDKFTKLPGNVYEK
jgi:DNA-binding MarR family transcriptional regulator